MAYLLTVASFTILYVFWIDLEKITRSRETERRRGAVKPVRERESRDGLA